MLTIKTMEELRDISIPVHSMRGIYILWKDGLIIYIGQSVNLHSRVLAHQHMGFDHYSIVEYETGELNEIEAEYIIRYKPVNNNGLPSNTRWKTCNIVKRENSLESITIVKKAANKYKVPTEIFNQDIFYYMPDMIEALEQEGKI